MDQCAITAKTGRSDSGLVVRLEFAKRDIARIGGSAIPGNNNFPRAMDRSSVPLPKLRPLQRITDHELC